MAPAELTLTAEVAPGEATAAAGAASAIAVTATSAPAGRERTASIRGAFLANDRLHPKYPSARGAGARPIGGTIGRVRIDIGRSVAATNVSRGRGLLLLGPVGVPALEHGWSLLRKRDLDRVEVARHLGVGEHR